MKKLNRILSLIICLVFTITSFAFVNTSVDAASKNVLANLAYAVKVDTTEANAKHEVIDNYYGRKCTHIQRAQSKNTFYDLVFDIDAIDNTKYLVAETSVIFTKHMWRLRIQTNITAAVTLATITFPEQYNTATSPTLEAEQINYNGWNDIKIVWKNVEGEKGYVYFNGICVAEFTVTTLLTSSNKTIRFMFDAPAKSKDNPEEIWIDSENTKVTQAVDNTVNFYNIHNELIDTKVVENGDKVAEISSPEVEHYDFLGWYEKDATTPFDFNTELNEHLNLYARYEAKTYDVVFKADGTTISTLSGKYGETVNGTIPVIPPKDNFAAVGWYIGETEEEFNEQTIVTGPMVVNAKYVASNIPKYTVKFMVDGVEKALEEVYEGLTVSMPENPTKEHYNFVGWTLNGAIFSGGTPITENITLEAKFEPKSYKVSLYTDDTLAELHSETTIVYNTAYGELPVLTKSGYKFLGWKTTEGETLTAESVITRDTKVYAVWESTTKVILDEDITQYTSLTGNKIEFLTPSLKNSQVYLDGGIVFKINEAKTTERTFDNVLIGRFRIPEGEYDEYNRTQVYNDRFSGEHQVEITYDAKLSGKYTADAAPFGYITTGAYDGATMINLLQNRLRNDRIESFNSGSESSNSFNQLEDNKEGETTKIYYPEAQYSGGTANDITVRIRYNTVTTNTYMTMDGASAYAFGTPSTEIPYTNAIRFALMNCFRVGDYVKIKRVKVTKFNDYSEQDGYKQELERLYSIVETLPDSIVEDPYDAKGIANLEKIDGVTWSSSNEEVVSSKTGVITPLFNDEEVIVTATIKSGIYQMTKEYQLTVKCDPRVNIKEVLNQTFKTESDLLNWNILNLGSVEIANYKVDENGIKFTKIQPASNPAQKYETKRYFASYDLYQLVKSDGYSVTETKELNGVYDVSFDFSKYSTSSVPMNINIGYRNDDSFSGIGAIKITKDSVKFQYQKTAEKNESVDLAIGDSAKLTFRIDNILDNISLFVDDVLVVDRVPVLNSDLLVNTLRYELDVNNNIGDYINVENITVTQLIDNSGEEFDALVAVADKIDVYDIVEDPTSVSGSIYSLPQYIDGYKVVWKSLSNQVNIETGEIFHDADAKKVYVTAEFYDEDAEYPLTVRKQFELNVRGASSGAELDKFKINSLGEITKQNYDDIRYDLELPVVDGVVWKSLNTDIITNNGKIVADAVVAEPTKVVMKAESNNEYKNYTVTVTPRTGYSVVTTGVAPLALKVGDINDAKLSSDVVTSFTYTANGQTGKLNVCDEKGTALVSLIAEADGICFDYFGTDYQKIAVSSAKVKIIVMPDIDKAAIFVDDKLVADNVTLLKEADYVAKVTSEINVGDITMSANDFGLLQANVDNIDYFVDVAKCYANANGINLPTQVATNAVVNWTSSNTSVLSADGTVNTPEVITDVKVEFKITDANNEKIYIEKTFDVSVDCDASKNLISGIVPSVKFENPNYPQNNLTDNNIDTLYKVVSSNVTDSDIIFNLGSAKAFNSVYVLQTTAGIEDYEVYVSNDGSAWTQKASGSIAGDKSAVIQLGNVNAQYVKFVVKKSSAAEVNISELKLFVTGTASDLAQYDLDALVIDTAPTGTAITLPAKGANGTVFTWESSNTSVISTDGKITKPQSPVTVTLTAKVNVNGQILTKTFDVYVDVNSINGPTQVGGGAGGGGGGGSMASNNADKTPIIGETNNDTAYSEEDNTVVENISSSSYSDVNANDWYYDAVVNLTNKGIVSGDGSGNFYPTNNVTREQFVKMILEALEIPANKGENKFADVNTGAWYADYIATAHSLNIINGLTSTEFGIGTNITRQDMAVLIERVLSVKEIEITKADVEAFDDADSVSSYAADAVANMKAMGLIKGYNNKYNPKDNLTRAEAATVITSLLELLTK